MLRAFLTATLVFASFSVHAQNPRLDIGQILVLAPDAPVAAVVVGNPKILDIAVEGERTVLVFGKASGTSDVVMLNEMHEVVYSARFTVAGPVEPRPQPPVAARAPAPAPPTVTVRGPTEQGMGEVRWVCGADRRCKKDAAQ